MVSIVTLRSVPGLTMHAGEYKGPRTEVVK